VPKVSDAHLAARRRQILDAAARCFARDGFHRTSMQDIVGASGIQVWAEAVGRPRIRALVRHGVDGPRASAADLIRAALHRGRLAAPCRRSSTR